MNTELLERLAHAARVQRARAAAVTDRTAGTTGGAEKRRAPSGHRAGDGHRRPATLSGDLAVFRAADVYQLVAMSEETGLLEVRAPGVRGAILIDAGRVVGAVCRPQPHRLGRVLVDGGHVEQPALDDALARQVAARGRRDRRRLGALLVERRSLGPAELERGLVEQAEAALAALLILPAGRFGFRRRPLPDGPVRITADPQELVLAALARFDELRAGRPIA
ncbi:MAG: DUF4388 domain-containing protein [Candidatus Eiseniibacteriota bacterium]|jgi:hypothetical protein